VDAERNKTESVNLINTIFQKGGVGNNNICRIDLEQENAADSLLIPTVLGNQLIGNPYSVTTMQQAYINLYGNNGNAIVANKKYVRFKPATETQLKTLSESKLDLFDYPLDREVILEGDYYPQPGITGEDYPWLYTVVDINYQPPSGMQYEVLQQIYVPDNDIWLEGEALSIAGNPTDDTCSGIINRYPTPCEIDPCAPGCPIDGCGGGGGGNPPVDTKKPSGTITVRDSNKNDNVPVRRTRVLVRRWFKMESVYTNDQGQFSCTKRFRNKVNIFVKFFNNNETIHGLRQAKFWQMWFPLKKGIGTYSGSLNNIQYNFGQNTYEPHSRTNRNWWAAQTMNSLIEYNEIAVANNTGQTPSFMRIMLTGWASARGSGSTPMNYHRNGPNQFFPKEWIDIFFVRPGLNWASTVANWLFNGVLYRQTDLTLGYDVNLESDKIKELTYHELSHAAHFNKVGQDWWNSLVYAEYTEIVRFALLGGVEDPRIPYGIGDDGALSDRIALSESWAEHIGRMFTDTRYGGQSSVQYNQGDFFYNNFPVTNASSHINLLEAFNPNYPLDYFRWIPYGLYYDLMDNRNDIFQSPIFAYINDQVSGYTNQQISNALASDIETMQQFKSRLLLQNGYNQQTQVNLLFNEYHY